MFKHPHQTALTVVFGLLLACPPPSSVNNDGNGVGGDDPVAVGFCGDGEVNGNEECDDGNSTDADGCRNNCLAAFCGDGLVRVDLEAGAEGDCLFHSIAAGLEEMMQEETLQGSPSSAQHVLHSFTAEDFGKGKLHLVAKLRGLVAKGVADLPPEDLLNLMITSVQYQLASARQHGNNRVWRDEWYPIDLLRDNGFGDLIHATSVAAVFFKTSSTCSTPHGLAERDRLTVSRITFSEAGRYLIHKRENSRASISPQRRVNNEST